MTTETDLMRRIMRRFSQGAVRLFRNSVGGAWHALPQDTHVQHVQGAGPTVTLRNARFVKYGLAEGSHDLIGWRAITIMPWHVGMTLAQFTSIETKAPKGRPTTQQLAFYRTTHRAGGLAAFIRTEQEAQDLLAGDLGKDTHDIKTPRPSKSGSETARRRMAGKVPRTQRPNTEPESP